MEVNTFKTANFKTRTAIINQKFPAPKDKWVLGLDLGYSAVKGMSPNKMFCFPAYARKVPAGRIVLKEPMNTDIRYKDDGGEWVVGSLAYDEVNASEVVDSEAELFGRHRYYSPMFKVIARVGIALGLLGNSYGNPQGKKILLQTGLPPKYEDSDTPLIKDAISGYHEFYIQIGRSPWQKFQFELKQDDISVMSQPLGALVSATVDKEGHQLPLTRRYFSSNVVIIDPGFGTTDDYTVKMGNVVGKETFSDLGMREVFSRTCKDIAGVYGVEILIPELQNYLDNGEVRVTDKKKMKRNKYPFGSILEENCRKVCLETIERMKSIHDFFSDVDYIIAAGGTYDAWADIFNDTFKDMEGLEIIPGNINDPAFSNVFSNVRGYYFYACNRCR